MQNKAKHHWFSVVGSGKITPHSVFYSHPENSPNKDATVPPPLFDYIEKNRVTETEAFRRIIEKMTPSI